MLISTRGRYALRMMVDLAQHQGEGYIPLKDIAKRQEISKKYLEQIVPVLNHAGLLNTVRGNQGGYRLVRQPDQYTVGEILRTTEGDLTPVACLECDHVCPRQDDCATRPVWEGLQQVVNAYLDSITLQQVVDQAAEQVGNDYVI